MKINLSRADYQALIFDKLPPYATGDDYRKLREWMQVAPTEQLRALYEKIKKHPPAPSRQVLYSSRYAGYHELRALDTANIRLR